MRSLANPRLARHFHRSAAWASKTVVQPFKLADIGEGITECEVIKWLVSFSRFYASFLHFHYRSVKPNDTVEAFDPLCEVQSDKASVEITSPFEGVVKELLVKEGEVAKVGSNLCLIEVVHEDDAEVEDLQLKHTESSTQEVAKIALEENNVPPAPAPKQRRPHPLDPTASVTQSRESADVLALPSVRHFAKSKGVDLSLLVPGSGRNGRVEKKDVEAYLSRSFELAAITVNTQEQAFQNESDAVVELGRTRYGMWKAMERVRFLLYTLYPFSQLLYFPVRA